MRRNTYLLTVEDFARAFAVSPEDIPEECQKFIRSTNYRYVVVDGSEKEQLMLEILAKTDADQQVIAAPERENAWNKGWEENLNEFIESGYDLKKLVPRFIRPNQYYRLFGNYVKAENIEFELDFVKALRLWLFSTYFKDYGTIYEFGCGTGHNLAELAHMFPDKSLVGLDFVPSSCQLVGKLGTALGHNITGKLFNMIDPDMSYRLCSDSLVFTFGVIEQLGGKFYRFLDYILDNSPGLCVHIEPIAELYDQKNIFDYLAARFHDKRGYTKGYLPFIQQLEQEGKLEILKTKRTGFGSLMMEGYSLIIWRPKRGKE
jgi:SAM-dependent methyltransferase